MAARNLVTISDLTRSEIDEIFNVALSISTLKTDNLAKKILATLFFQPSTRTRFSFEAAMHKLGGKVLSFGDPDMTRAGTSWCESLSDTAMMISQYADIVVMRHSNPEAIHEVTKASTVPVINAGNGIGMYSEHPTQALTDGLTILKSLGGINGVRVLLSGGLVQRSSNSLLSLLNQFENVSVLCFSPPDEDPKYFDNQRTRFQNLNIKRVTSYCDIIGSVDVVYLNGMSENRFDPVPREMIFNGELADRLDSESIILHPLPRGEELPIEVDKAIQAKYFEQAGMAVPLRMALISMMI